mmetsp:Transcript_52103/g.125816  ORF Transcript_52103/g.125816 Transcript_52103/m.125816 type:complete len:117 (+) Transcript_52103:758-1108(+)
MITSVDDEDSNISLMKSPLSRPSQVSKQSPKTLLQTNKSGSSRTIKRRYTADQKTIHTKDTKILPKATNQKRRTYPSILFVTRREGKRKTASGTTILYIYIYIHTHTAGTNEHRST